MILTFPVKRSKIVIFAYMKKMFSHNEEFVKSEAYKKFEASKYPALKTAIVTCMDTRLVALLPAALGIGNGDVKMIKNAGGLVTDPYGDSMRSLLVAIYELGVENVMIIAHTNCGVEGMKGDHFIEDMKRKGITAEKLEAARQAGVNLEKWLTGFTDTEAAVRESVELVRNHPLIPAGVTVNGYIIDTLTGALQAVES